MLSDLVVANRYVSNWQVCRLHVVGWCWVSDIIMARYTHTPADNIRSGNKKCLA